MGLFAFVPNGLIPKLNFFTAVLLGWVLYMTIIFKALTQHLFFPFLKWFGILVLLLGMNLVGCQMAQKSIRIGCEFKVNSTETMVAENSGIKDSPTVHRP